MGYQRKGVIRNAPKSRLDAWMKQLKQKRLGGDIDKQHDTAIIHVVPTPTHQHL